MLAGGHPHDRWVMKSTPNGPMVPRDNPASSAAITQILEMLSKVPTFLETNSIPRGCLLCRLFSALLWYWPHLRSASNDDGRYSAWVTDAISQMWLQKQVWMLYNSRSEN
ncbi:hypothetical protein PHMEG_00040284 [Phytophthora megakarya]|uniref:Uncharacterized protein n=1 Tax=Phytophthora megakarya TaxID=4795 RepID=A0A225UF58_9STRA|nr:hypothetical protein PHMEG_00040284 [Phytophthora megakarya]